MTNDLEVLGRCADELKGMTRDEIHAWHLIYNEAKEEYEAADEICSRHDADFRNRLITGLIHLALRIAEHHHDDLGWLDEELFLEVAAFRRLGGGKNGHDGRAPNDERIGPRRPLWRLVVGPHRCSVGGIHSQEKGSSMIRLDELYEDQLAQINLSWVSLSEIYGDDLEEGVDGSLVVLCYDGRYSLDPIVIFELEQMINEGATRDQTLLFLHEFGDDCEGQGWFDDEGADLHEWGQLR